MNCTYKSTSKILQRFKGLIKKLVKINVNVNSPQNLICIYLVNEILVHIWTTH